MMKKTLISISVLAALTSAETALAAGDTFTDTDNSVGNITAVQANAPGSTATATYKQSNNRKTENSFNPELNNVFQNVNANNEIAVGEDGIVSFGQSLDQAVATSDLDSSTSNNRLYVYSAVGNVAQALANNGLTATNVTHSATNSVLDSFKGASGVTALNQNNGQVAVADQSVVVQSNTGLR